MALPKEAHGASRILLSFDTAHWTTLDVICVPLLNALGGRSCWCPHATDEKAEAQRTHCQWGERGWDGAPRRPCVDPRLLTTTLDCSLSPQTGSCPSSSSFPKDVLLQEHLLLLLLPLLSLPLSRPSLSHSYTRAHTYICGPGHPIQASVEGSKGDMPKSLEAPPEPLLGDPVP